jgi:hypothetical protein
MYHLDVKSAFLNGPLEELVFVTQPPGFILKDKIRDFKNVMMTEFEMTDLGEISYFLGIEFLKTSKGLILHQRKYAGEILKRFNMTDCTYAVTPMEVGLKLEKNQT